MKPFVTKLFYSIGMVLLCGQLHAQNLNEAKELFNDGNYVEAKPAFETFVKRSPSNTTYNFWYGVCCYETGDMPAAEKHLSFAVKRRYIESFRYLGEVYYSTYRFTEAVDMYNQYIEWLEKKKRDTEEAEMRLDILNDASRMMDKVENIQIIDSVVLDKKQFLSAYKLSEESGKLETYENFFGASGVVSSVYVNQKGNKAYYARPAENKSYSLFSKSRLIDQWADEKPLALNKKELADVNYPFVLSDGVTLYFSAKDENTIGGTDLFVTRYNMNSDSYLAPERLGMPFNSPDNDYMIVYDEVKGLGWFVSDRFQKEGDVCVYLFVMPTEEHQRVETEDPEVKRARAAVFSIRDSWEPGKDYSDLVQLAHQEIPFGKVEVKKDFELVVQDGRIYYTMSDFKSSEAKTLYQKYLSLNKELEATDKKLSELRKQYADSPAKRGQLKPTILGMENKLNELIPQAANLEKQARNAEVRSLKSK